MNKRSLQTIRCRPLKTILNGVGICASLSLLLPSILLAGPWAKEDGAFYTKAFTSVYSASQSLSASGDGQVLGSGSYLGFNAGIYGEIGLGHGLMFATTLPYAVGVNRDAAASYVNAGLGDGDFAIQYQPELPIPLAFRLNVKIPFYKNQSLLAESGSTPYPLRGDGQIDVTPWVSMGGSFWPKPIYFFGELGWRHRTEMGPDPVDGLVYRDGLAFLVHTGVATDTWRGQLFTQGVLTPSPQSETTTRSQMSVGLGVARHLKGGLFLSLESEVGILAINTTRGQSVALGVSWEGSTTP